MCKIFKDKLPKPTKSELREKLDKCKPFECFVIYLIVVTNENTFSFISGLIANIPLSFLFFLISFKIKKTFWDILYLMLIFFASFISVVFTIITFQFSLKHIHIKNIALSESNREIRTNKEIEQCLHDLKYLTKRVRWFIVLGLVLCVIFVALCIIYNVKC